MGWSYLAGIGVYVAAAVAGCGGLAAVRGRRLAKGRRRRRLRSKKRRARP